MTRLFPVRSPLLGESQYDISNLKNQISKLIETWFWGEIPYSQFNWVLFSFPLGTKMFQFPRCPSYTHPPAWNDLNNLLSWSLKILMDQEGSFTLRGWMQDIYLFDRWVSPFGNLRIKVCLATPRSVSHAYCVLHRSSVPRHPPYALTKSSYIGQQPRH